MVRVGRLKKLLILLLILTIPTTFAYATVQYLKHTSVTEQISIGNTVKTENGLVVTLNQAEQGNLTFNELLETDTDKHTLTYIYDYEIMLQGTYEIRVSTTSNDIEIINVVVTDVISIEFGLNQVNEYVEGQIIDVEFYFELVESLAGYTSDNPIDINSATEQELLDIGFTSTEATRTASQTSVRSYTSLQELETDIQVTGLVDKYQSYVDSGIIVFN